MKNGTWAGFLIKLIRGYQATAPYRMPTCRFTPSCSEYMAQSIHYHGPLSGLWMGVKRITRCHPFHKGGYDPVPLPTPPTDASTDLPVAAAAPTVSTAQKEQTQSA